MLKFFISLLLWIPTAFALGPGASFKKHEQFGSVTNFRSDSEPHVNISSMKSDLEYADLHAGAPEELKSLTSAKREYGSVFGLKD